MARMTEEEAWALSKYVTDNEITLGPNGTGWLGRHEKSPWGLKNETVKYLMSKAMADHKSPAQIIDELVNKELATAV